MAETVDSTTAVAAAAAAATATASTADTRNDDTNKRTRSFSSEEFQAWLLKELKLNHAALFVEYTHIFEAAAIAVTKWRQRFHGDPALWKRLFDKKGVIKELVEAVPIIDAVQRLIAEADVAVEVEGKEVDTQKQKFTIVDLASGKGYLSMLLSEMLPPTKVHRFVLMDKAWASHGTAPSPHHMNWDHLCDPLYQNTWPIPLVVSKQDLKSGRQRRNLQQHYFNNARVILLAVHLCGTLSLKAVDFFNQNPESIHFFALKPCCLPGMMHAKRHEIFELSDNPNRDDNLNNSSDDYKNKKEAAMAKPKPKVQQLLTNGSNNNKDGGGFKHCFPAESVCMHGKWNKNTWQGPHRDSMKSFFSTWAENLFLGIAARPFDDDDDSATASAKKNALSKAKKIQRTVMVQSDGGYQNSFLFAQRSPTKDVWTRLAAAAAPTAAVDDSSNNSPLPPADSAVVENNADDGSEQPPTKRQKQETELIDSGKI